MSKIISNANSIIAQIVELFVCSVCGNVYHIKSSHCHFCGADGSMEKRNVVSPTVQGELLGLDGIMKTGISSLYRCYSPRGVLPSTVNLFVEDYLFTDKYRTTRHLFLQICSEFMALGLNALYICESKFKPIIDHLREQLGRTLTPHFLFLDEVLALLDEDSELLDEDSEFLEKITEFNPDIIFIDSWDAIDTEDEAMSKVLQKVSQHLCIPICISCNRSSQYLGGIIKYVNSMTTIHLGNDNEVHFTVNRLWGKKEDSKWHCTLRRMVGGFLDIADINTGRTPSFEGKAVTGVAAFSSEAINCSHNYSVDEIVTVEYEEGDESDEAGLWDRDNMDEIYGSGISFDEFIPDDDPYSSKRYYTAPNRSKKCPRMADLAVVISIFSEANILPIPQDTVFMASIDYKTGKLLLLENMDQRIEAARTMGYTHFIGAKAPDGQDASWEEYDDYQSVWEMLGGERVNDNN